MSPLGHVNLMTDTVIANLEPSDLRAVLRRLVATSPANASTFIEATRDRISNRGVLSGVDGLFFEDSPTGLMPTTTIMNLLSRARVYYGCGLSFESLCIFRTIASSLTDQLSSDQPPDKTAIRLNNELRDMFSTMDADISQAAQSCTEVLSSRQVRGAEYSDREVKDSRHAAFINKARSEVEALCEALRMLEEVTNALNLRISLERGALCLDSLQSLL